MKRAVVVVNGGVATPYLIDDGVDLLIIDFDSTADVRSEADNNAIDEMMEKGLYDMLSEYLSDLELGRRS